MHSILSRINNTSAFFSSCMMALLAAISITSYMFFPNEATGDISISSLKVVASNARRYPNKKQDLAFVNFNITADLSPIFHWNTKQVFVYLQAEYTNSQGTNNEVVIWDRIIRRKEDAFVKFVGKNKYMFRDVSSSFKNAKPANYSLKFNVMPYVGVLTYGEAARTTEEVEFPAAKSRI
ncbi:hypothetical protein CVT24_010008 [Panaeolus cyanescens]|uniref:Signal peptidase subunit 3 n=1 Tax=Panaeolus cyanescens TaxID=181874 RepID=A0A409VY83_9AGAR|nr:hypothetical protein CVT24_010008 [Panaeolus cyanescens]